MESFQSPQGILEQISRTLLDEPGYEIPVYGELSLGHLVSLAMCKGAQDTVDMVHRFNRLMITEKC